MTKRFNCPDCGVAPVNHKTEYSGAILNFLLSPIHRPMEALFQGLFKSRFNQLMNDYFVPLFLKGLVRLNIASVAAKPDSAKDELMLQCMWREALKRGIKIQQFILLNRRRGICIAEYNGAIHCFDRLPRPRNSFSESINWMDDKRVLKIKLVEAGMPAARGRAVFSFAKAKKAFNELEKPLVVKPHIGSASRHTTLHIENISQLGRAFKLAKKLSPLVMIEEELIGSVYRVTFIGRKIVGVIRRDQPQVVGTSRETVKDLVDSENKNPKRAGPIFSKISRGTEAEAELARQGLSWESVPGKGERVTLNPKINWSVGGTTTDATDLVHPDNTRLFEKIGSFINDPLMGIDFIIADIAKPWMEQSRSGVIECNSLPFIDNHHFPFYGEERDAAGALWDIVFPDSKSN